ncbi:cysteine desulfurase DndA [Haloferula sp.]|uniref:cysteine desulfurase DndA n=1 Tax=Haloferula sp. TaxID=2497595 RepID=UPI003C75F9F4
MSPVYLDCNATTPLDPAVQEVLFRYLTEEFGNEGSRTHEYGSRAKQAVQKARDQVAAVVGAKRDEVIFTSGATESNNLAILGLAAHGNETGKRHLIGTRIEHKAVIEPLEAMEKQGFEVTWLSSDEHGRVRVEDLEGALRPDTLLVSIMAANNETGVRQPLHEICKILEGHEAYLHTDAAQAFGKDLEPLRKVRIDLISVSGHKIYAPKGIGALITRRRGYDRPPLKPLFYGGGQERGLRPGTLPVAHVAALGMAAEVALKQHEKRREHCRKIKDAALAAFAPLSSRIHGPAEETMDHVLNLAFPGIDSEALIVALKDLVAISNGSACTSSSYTPSHVIKAMGYGDDEANEALRFSWCHMTPDVDWEEIAQRIRNLV